MARFVERLEVQLEPLVPLASLCGLHGRIERARGHLDQAGESFEASRRGWLAAGTKPWSGKAAAVDPTLAAFALALAPVRRPSL